MKGEKTAARDGRLSLKVAGVMVTAIGCMHFFMPQWGYENKIARQMPSEIAAHFYFLGTYAIGSFLLTLGGISIYVSRLNYTDLSMKTAFAFCCLWLFRFILELVYPVKLKLFFLDTPTTVLLPVIGTITVLYFIGGIGSMRSRSGARVSRM